MAETKPHEVSGEFVRTCLKGVNKFDHTARLLGKLYAIQSEREIGRLHTHYPGQRTELDYTKYGIWLFPTDRWNEPVFYNTGIGIDHMSRVIKGCTITIDPSARDAVRLYRNCVLPKSLWLPESMRHHTHNWDVFGIEDIVAIDNATDLTANAAMLMFMIVGAILLRMPPARGDLKGAVERTQGSLETMFISNMPGYVAKKFIGLDPRYKRMRDRAKAKAQYTVAEFQAKYVESILEFNHMPHPDLRKSRIQVWRDGQELAPIVMPTGRLQIRTIFSLTYEVTLSREGVEVERMKFNSPELHNIYLGYSGIVHVKLDPDDIRTVLVFVPQFDAPVEAFLNTFDIDFPMSLELLRILLSRLEARYGENDAWKIDPGFHVLDELHRVQTGPHTPTLGKTTRSDAQAAMHAEASPAISPQQLTTKAGFSLSSLLKGSKINGGE